jgi:acyl-CoA hydrolase
MVNVMETTLSHRLVLPGDANHYGTLYAGSLLRIALEAAYTSAYRLVGPEANLVLHRVMDLVCYHPVPVGTVIEIRGTALHITHTAMVIGLIGSALRPGQGPWMDALMSFAQVDSAGRPAPFPESLTAEPSNNPDWQSLRDRMNRLLHLR